MEKINWKKLLECVIFGVLMSMCIIAFSIIIVACVELISLSFEAGVSVITLILLNIGLTYWAYKNKIVDDRRI